MPEPAATMPLVGVVTAIGRPEFDLLREAGESLRLLAELIAGHYGGDRTPLEWVVCCDGDVDATVTLNTLLSLGLPLSVVATGGTYGPGRARNAALRHVRAPYLLTVDSDDEVVPAGMLALLLALDADSDAAWSAGRCYHVDAEGELLWVGPPDPWLSGPVPAGAFWRYKLREGGLPFLCTATVARTVAVRACGGWPADARARAEDTALWCVLTSRWPGVWVPEHVYDYRRHSASVTHSPGFRDIDENLDEIAEMIDRGNISQQRAPVVDKWATPASAVRGWP